MKFKGLILLALILLIGCSSKEGIAKEDLSIVKIDNEKAKVQYGMTREEAEKVLGERDEKVRFFSRYDSGVSVIYRDEKVVGVLYREEAADTYKVVSDLNIGATKEQLIEKYGDNYVKSNGERNLDYLYDTENNEYIDSFDKADAKNMQRYYIISIMFDNDNKASGIILGDYLAVALMQ